MTVQGLTILSGFLSYYRVYIGRQLRFLTGLRLTRIIAPTMSKYLDRAPHTTFVGVETSARHRYLRLSTGETHLILARLYNKFRDHFYCLDISTGYALSTRKF